MKKVYLGDGAYAAFDGYAIILTAENGIEATNTIVLEPEVLAALFSYVDMLKRMNEPPISSAEASGALTGG